MSETQGEDVSMVEAVRSYISNVLAHRRDESAVLNGNLATESIELADSVPTGLIVVADDDDGGDWRDKV
jgi:hypothetical protein